MKRILLTSVVAVALCGSAFAADMPAANYSKAAPIGPSYNWSGFYIGAIGGYGWSDKIRESIGGVVVTTSSNDLKGGFGGGTIGYNWQAGTFVVGVEADAAWSDIKFSETVLGVVLADKIRSFGSVTGRFGFAVDAALFYFKGGYAWADNQISATAFGVTLSESKLHSGWTVGGGLEYLFTPSWSLKGEYMYADYGNEAYLTAFGPGGIGLGATTHTVKAGVNYHFGGPVVARY
jgi:outer membrane immunogenic protein